MPITDKAGRSNLGLTSEHAAKLNNRQPKNNSGVRGNMRK